MSSSLQKIDDYTNKYQLPSFGRDGDCQKDDFEETTYCETYHEQKHHILQIYPITK